MSVQRVNVSSISLNRRLTCAPDWTVQIWQFWFFGIAPKRLQLHKEWTERETHDVRTLTQAHKTENITSATNPKGIYQFRYFLPQCLHQILLLSAHACMHFYWKPKCVYQFWECTYPWLMIFNFGWMLYSAYEVSALYESVFYLK